MKNRFSVLLAFCILLCALPYAALAGIGIELDEIDPPTNFTATASGFNEVTLSWTGVSYATDYIINRTDGGYTTTAAKSETTALDGFVGPGETYTYEIKTHYYDTSTSTDYYSDPVSASVTTLLPEAPANLKATVSGGAIKLTWDGATGADSYNVYRNGTLIASGITGLTYTDSSIVSGQSYTYEVETVSGSVKSSTKASTVYSTQEPGVVQNLRFENAKTTTLTFRWDPPASGGTPDYYEFTLGHDANYEKKVVVNTSNTYYNVTGLTCGKTYYYKVRAHVTGSVSEFGKPVEETYRTTPSAPTTFTAVQVANSLNSVKLTWNKESTAYGYIIQRKEETESSYTTLTRLTSSNILTYTDTTAVAGNTYTYRIRSYCVVNSQNVDGDGYTESAKVKIEVNAPQGLKAESAGNTSIKLTWTKVTGAAYYVVERNGGDGFKVIAQPTTNTYTDSDGIVFGKDYSYIVSAYASDSVHSDPCVPVVGHAVGAAPANAKATYVNSSSIKVTWSAVANANGYMVEGADTKTGPFTQIYEGTKTEYTETGLAVGKGRYYRVSAYVLISGSKVYGTPCDVVYDATRPNAPTLTVENTNYDQQLVKWNNLGTSVKYEFDWDTNNKFSNNKLLYTGSTSQPVTQCVPGTTYYYRVRGYVQMGTEKMYGPYSAIVSKLSAPARPASAAAAVTEYNKVKVTWPTVSGATGYRIYAQKDAGTWVRLANVGTTITSYTATGLTIGSHYIFAVRAVRNVNGKDALGDSKWTNEVEISLNNYIPKKFSETAISPTSIKINWETMPNLTTWQVKVTSNGSEGDSSYGEKYFDVNTNNITLSELKTGYIYEVQVRAKATLNGKTEYSNWSTVYEASPKTVPPTGLSVTSGSWSFAVSVDWKASTGCDGYIIERALNKDGPYTQIADLNKGNTVHYGDYDMTKADVGTTYYYRVCSYVEQMGKKEKSAYAGPASVVLGVPAPKTVKATPLNMGMIKITWNDIGADKYQILRSTKKDSGFQTIYTISGTSFSDSKLTFGTTYYYKVVGLVVKGSVTYTGRQSATVSAMPRTVAPTNVTATANAASVVVKWKAAAGATGYKVYYQEEGGGWKAAGTTTALTYTVSGLKFGTKYNFAVVGTAKASSGKTIEGIWSSVVSATTKTLAAPTGMKTSSWGIHGVRITWNKVTDATGYQVQWASYRTKDASHGTWYDKVSGKDTVAIIDGCLKNKTYWFRIRAYITQNGKTSYGPWSAEFTGYSAPKAATNLKATGTTKTNIQLTWTASEGADGYQILYKKSGATSFSELTKVEGADVHSYVATGLSPNTTYVFKVRSYGKETSTRYLLGGTTKEVTATTKK